MGLVKRKAGDFLIIYILDQMDNCKNIFESSFSDFCYVSFRAQWLSGRVLNLRLRGCGFEPHRCHCVVSLSMTH